MLSKYTFLLFILILEPAACGTAGKDAGATEINGLPIAGSSHHGMAIAATNVDESITSSRLYYYEFSTGKVLELLGAESGNPAVFSAGNKVFLFNRSSEVENFRSFDPKASPIVPSEPVALTGLSDGDPWDVAPLKAGETLLLASPLGGKLQVLDINSGVLGDATSSTLASDVIRPHALLKQNNRIYIAHSGIGSTGAADGTQQLYSGQVTAEGVLSLTDQDPGTPGIVDGRPLSATNPAGFLDVGADSAVVAGLCPESMPGCVAGADRISLANGAVSNIAALSSLPIQVVSGMGDGLAPNVVYAHVKNAEGVYEIVSIDLTTKQLTTVHTYSDARLYGFAYDTATRTLIVGSRDGLSGGVYLYRDGQLAGSFSLPGVPYHVALVKN